MLTNWYVLNSDGKYNIETSDGMTYQSSKVERIQDVDLALIYFNSSQSYPVARKGNSDNVSEGQFIHVGGYSGSPGRVYHFLAFQRITGFVPKSAVKNGYEIIFTGSYFFPGMSGSPLIDNNGNLIGICGLAMITMTGTDLYAIPINNVTNVEW